MIRKVTLVLFLHFWSISMAQELNVGASYHYLFAPQCDKIIQTYNFSRPFLSEKQPLFKHGMCGSVSYFFNSKRPLKLGIHVEYNHVGSHAKNENLDTKFNQHFLDLGCVLRFQNQEKWKSPYFDLSVSAIGNALFKRINGETFVYDDSKSRAFGIGAKIDLKLGYKLNLSNQSRIAPFCSIGCVPYFYSPKTETVINQTQGIIDKNWTMIFNAQIGLVYQTMIAN